MITTRWKALGLALVLTSACDGQGNEGATPPSPPPPLAADATPEPTETVERAHDTPDRWAGRWNGPEGTYLSISMQRDRYTLEISDLEGPRSYTALDVGDHLEFERNGRVERIRATDGKQTGMKWLQEKSDCLTIKPGEGYCRDPQ